MKRIVVLAALAGCGDIAPFYCANDAQCTEGAQVGTCTSFGFCAFADTSCPSGTRYHDSAGNLANTCVGQENAVPGDRPDQALPLEPSKTLDITGAHDDYQPSCGGAGGRDIFFQTSIGIRSRLYVDTYGTNYRAIIAVHQGRCASLGMELACVAGPCTDHFKQWSDILDPGTYCVIIDQQSSAETGTTLVVRSMLGPPAPDGQLGTVSGTTCDSDAWQGTCSPQGAPDQTWFFASCAPTTYLASTCQTAPTFDGDLQLWGLDRVQLACDVGCNGIQATQTTPGPMWVVAEAGATPCGPIDVNVSTM